MPAKTAAQKRLMEIAEDEPGKVYKKNRGVLKMSKKDLHDFTSKETCKEMKRGC